MALIEGVTAITNSAGEITHLTIEVEKQREMAAPILKQLSEDHKSAFRKEWEQAINIEDARARSLKHIDELWERSK